MFDDHDDRPLKEQRGLETRKLVLSLLRESDLRCSKLGKSAHRAVQ
jgi:hypothetical protein